MINMKKLTRDETRFWLTAFIVSVSLLGDGLIYAILPSSPESFNIRIWQIGVLLSANRIIRLITNEIAGRIINNDPTLRPLITGALFACLITFSYIIPWGFYGLLFSRLLWGACFSLLRIEGYLSALKVSSSGNRSRIFAVYQTITRFGAGGGAMFGGILADIIGIKLTFVLFGLIVFLSTFFLKGQENLSAGKKAGNAVSNLESRKDVMTLVYLGLSVFIIVLVDQMLTNLTGRIVVDRIIPSLPVSMGAASLTGVLIGTRHFITFTAPLIGWICDRTGRKKALSFFIVAEITVIAFFITVKTWYILLILILAHYVISCANGIIIYSCAGDRAPGNRQAIFMSRFSTFSDCGTAAGPLIGFAVYSGAGLGWVGAAAVPLLIGVLFIIRKV